MTHDSDSRVFLAIIALVVAVINLLIWIAAVLWPAQFPEVIANLAESAVGVVFALINLSAVVYSARRLRMRPAPVTPPTATRQVTAEDRSMTQTDSQGATQVRAGRDVTLVNGNVYLSPASTGSLVVIALVALVAVVALAVVIALAVAG